MPYSPARKIRFEPLSRDERYSTMPRDLRLFLLSLLMYVDALGREVATSRLLREHLYEFDEEVQPDEIDTMLVELERRNWLLLYVSSRRILLQVNPAAWKDYVQIDGRDGSRFPAPEPGPEAAQRASWGTTGQPAAEGKGGEGSAGETPAWMLDPEMPPPQGCPRHPNNTGLIPCGPCAGARKIHDRFVRSEITHEQAVAAWSQATAAEEDR